MICGYTDRFYFENAWWRRWCDLELGHKGDHFVTGHELDNATWAMTRAERERRQEEDAAREAEPDFVISQLGVPIAFTDLPSAPKKVAQWVKQSKGWRVGAQHSQTTHRPELFVANSKSTGARKGDVKTPERVKDHFFVAGILVGRRRLIARFDAAWVRLEGKTGFDGANHWDVVNGERVFESKSTPFENWLRVLAPKGAPKLRAPRKTKDQITQETGEWHE